MRSNPKVRKRDGSPPSSDKELLDEWRQLLNNDNGSPVFDLPPPANQDLPICIVPPSLEETRKAIQDMKNNKAAGLDCAITSLSHAGIPKEMLSFGKPTVLHESCGIPKDLNVTSL